MPALDAPSTQRAARTSLDRLWPRLEPLLSDDTARGAIRARLDAHFPDVFRLLLALYGDQYDFFYHLEQVTATALRMAVARPSPLRDLDARREADPDWYQSERMMGAFCYVRQYAGSLAGIRASIPYFRQLGLTYLHLMPLFRAPEEQNDGGYAISSYREVDPAVGTMDELERLAAELRDNGISLVLDFVFNHTSDEHEWARRALAGDEDYQAYYLMFADRTLPDRYERTLREIFPEQAPGSFTYVPQIKRWVWTTFHPYQWDLNYRNPAVFRAMLEEMLFLANRGAEVLRLDAVPFVWKEIGTPSESLPQAHLIIQAFNALVRIAAPALLFKSEAIIHPRDVASYVGAGECQLSYNPTLMVEMWESLATREVKLLRRSMQEHFMLPPGCAWINYVRSHDDIGWGFADEDAAAVGIHGFDHRHFLNMFYIGRFPGSFARGLPFNYNPRTQDMRISGTTASLAGLEKALADEDAAEVENAVRRMLLMQSIALSAGGIPLLNLGDEVAMLNDYRFERDPARRDDNRWIHRAPLDEAKMRRRNDPATLEGRLSGELRYRIALRKALPGLAGGDARVCDSGNPHVLAYARGDSFLALCSFSEFHQRVERGAVAGHRAANEPAVDLLTGRDVTWDGALEMEPYAVLWLMPVREVERLRLPARDVAPADEADGISR